MVHCLPNKHKYLLLKADVKFFFPLQQSLFANEITSATQEDKTNAGGMLWLKYCQGA